MILIKNFNDFILEGKKIYNVDKNLIDQFGKYKIYTVNGEKVRDIAEQDEEFGLSSSYFYFPKLIPKNEIWIEDDVKGEEQFVLIQSELYKIKLIESGMDKWEAYHQSEKIEKGYREELNLSKKSPEKTNKKGDDDLYVKKYCKINSDDIQVWLVDAKKVRNKFKSDFMEGGHGYVYKWIPNDEIWIENGIKEHEVPFILLHEFVERTLMKEEKMNYDKSHNISAKVEWSKRPDKISKNDMENMTEEEALKLGNKFKN